MAKYLSFSRVLEHSITTIIVVCAVASAWAALDGVRRRGASDQRSIGREPTKNEWLELTDKSSMPSVVVFSDVECPACRELAPQIEQARIAYSGRVRFLLRNFPLPYHRRALAAATLIECTSSEHERWLLHNRLLANQDSIIHLDFMQVAFAAGIGDTVRLRKCANGDHGRQRVERSLELTRALGLAGTPTVLIDGSYVGLQNLNSLESEIERVLRK
ncbi:DsbA family protein [Gemmatimonas sp.]|uniref:DsbA family protein n=1 Tax=Gemmatimonas sp. TaxID=1962908 RepID=UPI003DA4EB63